MEYRFENKRFEELMEERGWRGTWIAKKLGVCSHTISRYKTGYTKPPKTKIRALAKLFNVPENEFMKIE